MKRLFLSIALMVPLYAVIVAPCLLLPGRAGAKLDVHGWAYLGIIGCFFVLTLAQISARLWLADCFGISKTNSVFVFLGFMLSFAVVLPVSYFIGSLVFPGSVTITEPLYWWITSVAVGVAAGISNYLEDRFFPKPKKKSLSPEEQRELFTKRQRERKAANRD